MTEQAIIESLAPNLATIRLTRTMLEKHIIDANESVRRLALLCGIDYQTIGAGEKITRAAMLADGTETAINFYKTKRGDKRVSISKLKHHARPDDLVGITYGIKSTNKEQDCECGLTESGEWSEQVFDQYGCECPPDVFLIINITATAERRNEVA